MKIHRTTRGDEVVAVCDRELLNTTLVHGAIRVDISEKFYGASLATPDEVRAALRDAVNVNLMGERSVAIAREMGLIEREGCIMIGTIPHAQVFRI